MFIVIDPVNVFFFKKKILIWEMYKTYIYGCFSQYYGEKLGTT